MSEVPFRNRPVLEHIVEQHAEEAAFLSLLRDAATEAPHYKRHHLARLDERVEAHIDGLCVAGEAGWRCAVAELKAHPEPGELFAAGVLALESGSGPGSTRLWPGGGSRARGGAGFCRGNRVVQPRITGCDCAWMGPLLRAV